MDVEEAKTVVESILFVADEPVTTARLAETLEVERAVIAEAARSLAEEYQGRGLRVQIHDDKVQIVTAPEMGAYVERFLGLQYSGKLSAAALETLAIVAYRQPITTPEIEAVRGVNCQGVLKNLLARGLIDTAGRLETAGRPLVYTTTFEFLQHFGLASLGELPNLEEIEPADEE
jgi:segregation and condensation protein B